MGSPTTGAQSYNHKMMLETKVEMEGNESTLAD